MTFRFARCLLNVPWPRSLDCSGRCRGSKVCEAATSAGLKPLNQLCGLCVDQLPPLSTSAFSASLLLFPLPATHIVVQAVHQAEEKSQALADACCDLVVTACELLQVSGIQLVCSARIAGLILRRVPSFTHIFSGFKLFGVGAIF